MDVDKLVDSINTEDTYTFPEVGDWHMSNAIAFFGSEVTDLAEKIRKEKNPDKKASLKDRLKNHFRARGKILGLAINYGGKSSVIMRATGVGKEVAEKMYHSYFSTLSTFSKYLKRLVKKAEENLFVETFLKRRLWVTDIKDPKWKWKAINNVYNSSIQSTGAEQVKLIYLSVGEWMEKYNLSRWHNNNVTRQYIHRIVSIKESDVTDELERELEECKEGHTLVITLDDNGEIVNQFDRLLQLKGETVRKYSMKVEW